MTPKLLLPLAACLLAVAIPSSALAQGGPGDSISDPIPLGQHPLSPQALRYNVDTTNYGSEAGEPLTCRSSAYDKTVWSAFSVNRTGRMDVTAAGFDSAISLYRLTNTGGTRTSCTDRLNGRIESFPRDALPTVKKGGTYAIQVGGFRRPDGGLEAGQLEVATELLRPERVQGDAILTWRSTRGGVKVSSLKVDGPTGSAAGITCLRKSCGRRQIVRNPKRKGVFARSIGKVDPGKTAPPARSREQVTIATTNAFRGRKIKNGARLVVFVLAEDQIGQAFYWDVKKNAAGPKNLACVEPDGSRIQRQGTCDGA